MPASLKIEYYGEKLSLKDIAEKEDINPSSLGRAFREKGNIYEAVQICKDNKQKLNGNIEYYGEVLSLKAIAKKENLAPGALSKKYKETGDIYEAVKASKESQQKRREGIQYVEYNEKKISITSLAKKLQLEPSSLANAYEETGDIEKAIDLCRERQKIWNSDKSVIEFNGANLTLAAIARRTHLHRESLQQAYEEMGDIYKAIQRCKDDIKKLEENIVYNGEKLTIRAIAKKEDIVLGALRKKFHEIKDIYEAVRICKEQKKEKKDSIQYLEYKGERLSIGAIARKEGLRADILGDAYKETQDIEKAVKICKNNQEKRRSSVQYVEYHGENLSIKSIADREGITPHTLKVAYQSEGDIYKAIELCKSRQDVFRGTIEYNGEKLSLKAIAEKTGLPHTTLDVRYKETGNIYKAVFICQSVIAARKRKQQIVKSQKYGNVSYYDLSVILGIEYAQLKHLLAKGYTPAQIENMNLNKTGSINVTSRAAIVLPNGQSLKDYCINNGLNYACIYRAMTTYNKSLTDAENNYKTHGQSTPTTWIYEKYGVLLKHLLLRDKIDIDRVIQYMRSDIISLEDAVKKYIINKNSEQEGLYSEWMEELYDVLTDESIKDEYDDYLKTFYVDEKEEECIKKCYAEVEQFKRKQLLYEIAEVLRDRTFAPDEEPELLKMYNITPDEIDIIFTDLYDRFEDPGILMGAYMQKVKTPQEIQDTNNKIAKYKQMIRDNQILEQMRATVKENVANNQETRTEIDEAIRNNEEKNNETNDNQ